MTDGQVLHDAPVQPDDRALLDEPGDRVLHDEDDELARLSAYLCRWFEDRSRIEVLEAGCGRQWKLSIDDLRPHITGVDLDAEVMRRRVDGPGDLDRAVVADLREVRFEPGSFDLVYSSFVLEHVAGAETLLDRFVSWLRPGGLLVLRVPDRQSVYGFVTRRTPHRLHVLYRRHVLGMPDAGTPGHGPFPVVYDPVVSRSGLRGYCARRPLALRVEWPSDVYLGRMGRYKPLAVGFGRAARLLSLGRLDDRHNNLTLVIEKPARPVPIVDGGA